MYRKGIYEPSGTNGQSRGMIPMGGKIKDFNINYKPLNYDIINNRVRISDGNIIRDKDIIPCEYEDETYKRIRYAEDVEFILGIGCIIDNHDMSVINEVQLAFRDLPALHNSLTVCKYDDNDRLKSLENEILIDNGNYHLLLFEIDIKSNTILSYKKKPDDILEFIKSRLYVYAY